LAVFSAPKYCDSTENKGAYINIGPELKLEYHQFDAVPHPDIKPMVSSATTATKATTDPFTRLMRRTL
jgi:serine/threonine-protein phosphatase 5